MVCDPVPTAVGVYVTEHFPVGSSGHVAGLNVPAPLVVQLTAPAGTVAVPALVSVTVAVHVVGASTGTDGGVQVTLVDVDRFVTVTLVAPLLVLCAVSPPYAAVIVCVPLPTALGV